MSQIITYVGSLEAGAFFSECRLFRYTLWRRWAMKLDSNVDAIRDKPSMVAFIGLNPSTADEKTNDPTVTRCINYAKAWGFDGMVMLNLFAFRATDPKVMKQNLNPRGPLNFDIVQQVVSECAQTICCWGNHGSFMNQSTELLYRLRIQLPDRPLWCLGLNDSGEPKHPLYLKSTAERIPFKR